MPKVSVIMPIYNAKNYLEEAIESVLNQTYSDFELLLINDASTDNSQSICQKYAEIDKRVVLLENVTENHGPGPTRNIGLNYATGKYIYFMDADDWVELELLEYAVDKIEEDCSDIVEFGYIIESYYPKRSSKTINTIYSGIVTKRDIENNILKFWHGKLVTLWIHLFRKDKIDDIRFENIMVGEDASFFIDIVGKAEKISYIDKCLYHYRVLLNSTYHRWNDNIIEWLCVQSKHEKQFLDSLQRIPSIEEYAEIIYSNYTAIIYELCLPWCPLNLKDKLKKIKKIQEELNIEYYRNFFTLRNKSIIQRVMFVLITKKMELFLVALASAVLKITHSKMICMF